MELFSRKKSDFIEIYSSKNEWYSGISGRNYLLRLEDGKILIEIDLTQDIFTQNKQENSHMDIMEIIEKKETIKKIVLSEMNTIEHIAKNKAKYKEEKWELILKIGRNEYYKMAISDLEYNSDKLFICI